MHPGAASRSMSWICHVGVARGDLDSRRTSGPEWLPIVPQVHFSRETIMSVRRRQDTWLILGLLLLAVALPLSVSAAAGSLEIPSQRRLVLPTNAV